MPPRWPILNLDTRRVPDHRSEARTRTPVGNDADDHLDTIAGKRDQLAGRIQEGYGITKDQVEVQIKAFEEAHKDYAPPRAH